MRAYLLVTARMLALLALAGCATKFEADADEDTDVSADTSTDGPGDVTDTGDPVPDGSDCGNGEPEEGEECDDGNDVDGDGCDNDCTYSCHESAECLDDDMCNGDEICEPDSHTCEPGDPLADGTLVDVGPPRIICLEGVSAVSECGDYFVDTGAGEFCDPPGEGGCTDDCNWACSGDGDCPDDTNICNGEEYCNSSTHVCDRRDVPVSGTACDDEQYCTDVDECDGAGTCVGSGNPCIDSVACTEDLCDESDDSCSNPIEAGACYIDSTCYAPLDPHPTIACQRCDPSVSRTSWTDTPFGLPCPDEGLFCTTDRCNAGVCEHPINSGHCLIAGVCYGSGNVNPANECEECDPSASQTSWTPDPSRTCDDGDECTLGDYCDTSGRCTSATWLSNLVGAVQITAGSSHVCVLLESDRLKCWGNNFNGQLGDGTNIQRSSPVQVTGLSTGMSQVEAGNYHTCAVTDTGGAKCWGFNASGQLGDDSYTESWTPVDVFGLGSGVSAICGGAYHSCALLSSTEVRCWGSNEYGQLGKGDSGSGTQSPRPMPVLSESGSGNLSGVSAIACGGYHTCALKSGQVLCWGNNSSGQLGTGSYAIQDRPGLYLRTSETDGSAMRSVDELSLGMYHSCARQGTFVKCWGSNSYDQLGDGSGANRPFPVDVRKWDIMSPPPLLDDASDIEMGFYHSCTLTTSRGARCWGRGDLGQLGDGIDGSGHTQRYAMPVFLDSGGVILGDLYGMAGGYQFTCAIRSIEGNVMCWGDNSRGQLGDGSTTNSLYPVYTRCGP